MELGTIPTGVFTLTGALGGVWLTQRNVEREAQRARVEARRDAQRRVIAELLIAGYEKTSLFEVVLLAMHKAKEGGELDSLMESETATRLAEINTEFSRALVEAGLLVGDGPAVNALLKVRSLELNYSKGAVGPSTDTKKGFDGLLEGLRYNRTPVRALYELERESGVRACSARRRSSAWRFFKAVSGRIGRWLAAPYRWWADTFPRPIGK